MAKSKRFDEVKAYIGFVSLFFVCIIASYGAIIAYENYTIEKDCVSRGFKGGYANIYLDKYCYYTVPHFVIDDRNGKVKYSLKNLTVFENGD